MTLAGPRFFVLLLCATVSRAQDFESFHVEATASAWLLDTSGGIQSGIAPVDLRTDLGIEQRAPHFFGRLVFKPTRRNRLLVEGMPYRLEGVQAISRQIVFAGRTYSIQDVAASRADINYIFGGYQFDAVSRPRGHFGIQAGVGYVDASGTVTSRNFGFSGTEAQSFPFPLAGVEFRVFAGRWMELNGSSKGMALGSYGHYVEGAANAGVNLGKHFTVEAGYRIADADVHRKDQTKGFAPRFTGPVFSIVVRD